MSKAKHVNYRPCVGFYQPHTRHTDYRGEQVNPVTGEVTRPGTMTKQEFIAQCDINNIIKEFTLTGQVSHISAKAAQGAFLDLPEPMDLQQSLAIVERAQGAFDQLPAKVRERFGNDPVQFMEFMNNPANREEAGQLGLLKTPPVPPAPETPAKAENPAT